MEPRDAGRQGVEHLAGAIAAMCMSWIVAGKPDLSMSLNGILAGLVGITAGADTVTIGASVLIGLVAGRLSSEASALVRTRICL